MPVGPVLALGADPASHIDRLNAWGARIDSRMDQLENAVRGSRTSMEGLQQQIFTTQVALTDTVDQAKTALNGLTEGFRVEVTALREKIKEDGEQHLRQVQALASAAQDKFQNLEDGIQRLVGSLELLCENL